MRSPLLVLAAALAALAASTSARAAEVPRIAFLGLRPTEGASLSGTAIAQLPEAQRLRAVAENVSEMLSGSTVLRHEELRAALGPTYLVDLFDCRGDAACQLRVAAPLARRGVSSAVAGDYFAGADGYRMRIRRFDLARGRLADEVTFPLLRADAESLAPWRRALGGLFQDTGALRIVTNVAAPACSLDGRPCQPTPDGLVASVPEGEHLLELSKEGHRRAHRVVVVKRREELRVALPLEELPIQAQKAPDPNDRAPTFAAPGETTRITPYGLFRLAIGWDDANNGDREDPLAIPRQGGVEEGGLVVLPRPAIAGLSIQAPRSESGWQVRGALATAWVKDTGPEIDAAYAEVVNEGAGFRAMLGQGQGIVSSLTAGTLTLPEGFGDLAAGFVGLTVSQSAGPLVFEGFVGRHKSQFSAESDPAGAAPGPFGAAHVALVSSSRVGRLYGQEYPLTIGVSGVYGQERVGLADEQEWAAAAGIAAPLREDVAVWAGSFEAHVPFGKRASLAGEAFLGENVHLLEGALWQGPRVDPASGRHGSLRSAGGWLQLSLNVGQVELRAVGGLDRAVGGLSAGVAPGDAPVIRENRLAAVNAVWYALEHLALGVQVHGVRTFYEDPALGTPTLVGAAFTSQLQF